jgi:hypothetical protein
MANDPDSKFFLHGLSLASGLTLTQLTDLGEGLNTEPARGWSAGHPHPMFTGIAAQAPAFPFTTQQLAGFLGACSMNGLPQAGNCDLLFRAGKLNDSRVALATTSHQRVRATGGYLYWDQVGASGNSIAEATGHFVPTYDGTNAILVPTGSVAATGITPQAAEQFKLGPVKINGTFLAGVQSWSLATNPQVAAEFASGVTWPGWCGLEATDPVLTVTTLRKESLVDYGVLGTAISSLVFYLRRIQIGAGPYGDGSSQHLKFTAGGGMVVYDGSQSGGNTKATVTLMIRLHSTDPDVLPVTVATAQTIT